MLFVLLIAVAAFTVTYFSLRNSGGTGRHILVFVLVAVGAAFLTVLLFELNYPYRGDALQRRWDAAPYYAVGAIVAAILSPIVGMVAAMRNRRKVMRGTEA